MIITGGRLKGRKIKAPKDDQFRPSSSLLKESLFNILYNEIIDSTFLDLFAGTGAVGMEAISRGAQKAIFVEKNSDNVRLIKENSSLLEINDSSQILQMSVEKALSKISIYEPDIIFMDPPYDMVNPLYIKEIFNQIKTANILDPYGYLILESPASCHPEDFKIDTLELFKSKKYGKSLLSFWIIE